MKLFDLYGEINLNAKKTKKGIDDIHKRVSAIGSRLKSLAKIGTVAFAALSAASALVSRSFILAASSMEDYEVRLTSILGSQKKAANAMKFFTGIASKVPFSIEKVAEAGVMLEAMGAKHKKWLPVLSDLAAVMGEDIAFAASALGRAYAGGAGAADVFREKGILEIIKASSGIRDFSKKTLPEFRDAMFDAFIDTAGKIEGSAKRMASTWTGQLSMLGDSVFKLKNAIGNTLLPSMKELVTFTIKPLVNEWLEWVEANKEILASNTKAFVQTLSVAIKGLGKAISFVLDNYMDWIDIFILGSIDMNAKWSELTSSMKTKFSETQASLKEDWLLIKSDSLSSMDKLRLAWLNVNEKFQRISATGENKLRAIFDKTMKALGIAIRSGGQTPLNEMQKAMLEVANATRDQMLKTGKVFTDAEKDKLNTIRRTHEERLVIIKAAADKEKDILKSLRKGYLASMTARKNKNLEANKDIEDSNSETQEDITEKNRKESKKRQTGLMDIVAVWQETQKRIIEGQKGITKGKGISGIINVKSTEKEADKFLGELAKLDKEGNNYLKKISDNIEVIKNQSGETLATMG